MSHGHPSSVTAPSALQDSTSTSLLQRVKGGDADAWQRLAGLYAPLVYSWCRRFSLSVEDTADVSQEVFRAVLLGLQSFRRERIGDSFRGWLWTITRNKIYDHFRISSQNPQARGGTDAYQHLLEMEQPSTTCSADNPGNPFDELAQRAIRLMRQDFEPPTWQAFWRTAIEKQPVAVVSRELGMSPAAIYQAKSRVLRRLREELADFPDG